nr:hypothetical protein [Paenibacillus sp. HB172176]
MGLIFMLALTGCANDEASIFDSTGSSSETAGSEAKVPWDYKIVEGTVGDLVGSDMTILPDNQLLPNDNNYGTGDKVWLLQFMDADLITDKDNNNQVQLSAWRTIKSFKDEAAAKEDMDKLKISVTTELDLVGVYKTEYNGQTRDFAVVELPSGNRIKQPIDDARYDLFEKKITVEAVIEEVHDFADYDLAYAKFRGWAN